MKIWNLSIRSKLTIAQIIITWHDTRKIIMWRCAWLHIKISTSARSLFNKNCLCSKPKKMPFPSQRSASKYDQKAIPKGFQTPLICTWKKPILDLGNQINGLTCRTTSSNLYFPNLYTCSTIGNFIH